MSWFETNWGNLASLVGLLITLITLFVARGARRAAREAKKAVETRTMSQELKACGNEVGRLHLFCASEQWEISAHLCWSVIQDIAFAKARWQHLFSREARLGMERAGLQLDTVATCWRDSRSNLLLEKKKQISRRFSPASLGR